MMDLIINKITDIPTDENLLCLVSDTSLLKDFGLSEDEIDYVLSKKEDKGLIEIPRISNGVYIIIVESGEQTPQKVEKIRKDAESSLALLSKAKHNSIALLDLVGDKELVSATIEGVVLGRYTFNKYKTKEAESEKQLKSLSVVSPVFDEADVLEIYNLLEAVYITRDLVNEPLSELNAEGLGDVVKELSHKAGYKVDVYNKAKIEALKFGGLLAVNRGSIDPPTFSVLEWKPENAVNENPIVLVGKGVVFDTGGINLKTPPGSLDTMKCDMAGAASVVGALYAVSKNQLPVHVIGLIPATDNRPSHNAIVPGDVISMHNGMTVEVMNTDAEGRLILADALSYAKRYNPELVIDLATLTGSAMVAIGTLGSVVMGTAEQNTFKELEDCGNAVYERVVQFPFWEEYDKGLKSPVADVKNIGGREGGAITAGRFLNNFTDYPWIHIDIAGPAFLNAKESYLPQGGTGVGVRLLYRFLKNKK